MSNDETLTIKLNMKVVETEAFLAVLSEILDLPTNKVTKELTRCNIRSWRDFVELVHLETGKLTRKLQQQKPDAKSDQA